MPTLFCSKGSKLTSKPFPEASEKMVWVSNRGVNTIHVSITNNNGGSAATYTLAPQLAASEVYANNHWKRSGNETLTIVRDGGAQQLVTVGPSDFVRVYSDVVIVSQANVLAA